MSETTHQPNNELRGVKRLSVFGFDYHAVTFNDLLIQIESAIEQKRRLLIGYNNLHGIHIGRTWTVMAEFLAKADIVYADGMPLIWWRNLLWRDASREYRFTLSQKLPELLRFSAARGYRIFYVGSEEQVLKYALERLTREFEGLKISGTSGFFDKSKESAENKFVLERIAHFQPDILMVGMGMPVQEQWIIENCVGLQGSVIYATGAAIEYFSGEVSRPPAWVSNAGLEWLYRLISQPTKLWRRYLVEPFALIAPAINDLRTRFYSRP